LHLLLLSHKLITGGFVDKGIKTRQYTRASQALFTLALFALAMLFSAGTTLSGQTVPAAQTPQGPPTASPPIVVRPSPEPPNQNPPDDITRREVAEMDRFLDAHPEIDQQLRKDPSLIDNQKWVADHPALQEYLHSHPQVADAFRANPNLFMRDENRFDRQQDDITRRDLEGMGNFLNSHPEIAEQLRKDPSLIDNRDWVAKHPELREYLQSHPQVAEAFRAHPDAFMRDENRFDRQTDISRTDLAEMDRFLDSHKEVAEQLRKDPSLIDNRQWVANHPALQEYLHSHPQVAEAFRSDPNVFMRDEDRYDRNDGGRGGDDRNRGELTGFGQFLGGHSDVAAELANDPSLANNKEYLATHPELDEYLKAHPPMSQQLAENPQAVMSSTWVQQGSGVSVTAKPGMPKPKSTPNQ
jgi:hypothetical protein